VEQAALDHAGPESVVRLTVSHAALPGGPSDATAATIARLLGPSLDDVLAV
jgi:hypothetical protein